MGEKEKRINLERPEKLFRRADCKIEEFLVIKKNAIEISVKTLGQA